MFPVNYICVYGRRQSPASEGRLLADLVKIGEKKINDRAI